MSVVIFADSQALSRETASDASYPKLLSDRLKNRLGEKAPAIIDRAIKGRTIRHVLEDWDKVVKEENPKVVIVQVGGCDCAPRLLLTRELAWLDRLPIPQGSRKWNAFTHRYRQKLLSVLPRRVEVPLPDFSRGLSQVFEKASGRFVIFINIALPSPRIAGLVPGVWENISLYNRVLERTVRAFRGELVDLREFPGTWAEAISTDGIHLSERAHRYLARRLEAKVLTALTMRSA